MTHAAIDGLDYTDVVVAAEAHVNDPVLDAVLMRSEGERR